MVLRTLNDHIHKDDDERGIQSAFLSRGSEKILNYVLQSLLESHAEVYVNNDKVIVELLVHIKSDNSLL